MSEPEAAGDAPDVQFEALELEALERQLRSSRDAHRLERLRPWPLRTDDVAIVVARVR